MKIVRRIEFYPFYDTTGIWIEYDWDKITPRDGQSLFDYANDDEYDALMSAEYHELPFKPSPELKAKIETMALTFEMFGAKNNLDHKKDYGLDAAPLDFMWMEHVIICDFKREFPQFSDLVYYSPLNPYKDLMHTEAPKSKPKTKPSFLSVVK